MDRETEDEILKKLADGGIPDSEIFTAPDIWPKLLDSLVGRIDQIVATFPVPKLGAPPSKWNQPERLLSPIPSSPLEPSTSADANKENTDPTPVPAVAKDGQPGAHTKGDDGALPPQIQDMLDEVVRTLRAFPSEPPHTIQRIAELILDPKRHYAALAPYLHALDRVVHVTSPSTRYPLEAPDLVPNGVAETVSWGNTFSTTVGSDEALGGALLTPIPWLSEQSSREGTQERRAELRTESTETIEGPNGVGSIETVSISVNGIPSMTSSSMSMRPMQQHHDGSEGSEGSDPAEEEDEEPHARGPEEIDAKDLGPHATATNMSRDEVLGLQPQEIDLEAAVGRKPDSPKEGEGKDGDKEMEDAETGSKRGPEDELEDGLASKKARSEDGDRAMDDAEAEKGAESNAESRPQASK